MKYKLAQSLMQKEVFRSAARSAGKYPESGDARMLDKNGIGKPIMQFKYCWQSNDRKHMNDSNRLDRIFKNSEIK